MKRAVLLFCLLGAVAAAAPAETVEEILARYVEARGGIDNLRAIETVVATGTAVMGGGGFEMPFRYEWKRPDKFRFERTMQGITTIQASDGASAWEIDPPGQPQPEPMGAVTRAMINDAVDFVGPLVDAAAKGHQVELVGKDEIEGSEVWKLKVTKADGQVEHSFLDPEYFLEIGQVEVHDMDGRELVLRTTWSDYKEFEGALLPGSWSQGPLGAPPQMTLLFENIEVNVEIPDERFAMPAGK